jgi:hypothetical protein
VLSVISCSNTCFLRNSDFITSCSLLLVAATKDSPFPNCICSFNIESSVSIKSSKPEKNTTFLEDNVSLNRARGLPVGGDLLGDLETLDRE